MKRSWLAMAIALGATQCGGVARTTGDDLCVAGAKIECDCIGHTKGTRSCTADGIGYDACVCSGGTGGNDDAGSDAGSPPTKACTSSGSWTGGLSGSDEMTPGRPCIDCHAKTPRTPQYTVAGTVFANAREPDDCNGVDGLGVAIALMSENGVEMAPRIALNGVGNFFIARALPAQYRVKIIAQGRESVMQGLVNNGDCNLCHTASGASGASGRLVRPL
jgi:hypothetical protein